MIIRLTAALALRSSDNLRGQLLLNLAVPVKRFSFPRTFPYKLLLVQVLEFGQGKILDHAPAVLPLTVVRDCKVIVPNDRHTVF